MTAINLGSLSTFWTAIKNFFKTNSYESVVLYDDTESTNVDLSETIDNFERIEVTWRYDGNPYIVSEFVPSLTTEYFSFFSSYVYGGGDTYFKICTFKIDSTRKNITVFKSTNNKITFGSTAAVTRNVAGNFKGISKIVGIHRIASN